MHGCLEWQRRGDLEPPPEVLSATKQWQEESDVIGRFIAEKCEEDTRPSPPPTPIYQVRGAPLYAAYKAWCESAGERWDNLNKFGGKMAERGYEKILNNGVIYKGLRLNEDDESPVPF